MKYVRLLALGAVAATLMAGLGACDAQPDQAVSVNGVSYSVSDINQALSDYATLSGTDLATLNAGGLNAQTMVQYLLNTQVIIQMAKDVYQVEATPEDLDAQFDAYAEQLGGEVPSDPGLAIQDMVKSDVLSKLLAVSHETSELSQQFSSEFLNAAISVNPRYALTLTDGAVAPITGFGDVVSLDAATTETIQ